MQLVILVVVDDAIVRFRASWQPKYGEAMGDDCVAFGSEIVVFLSYALPFNRIR